MSSISSNFAPRTTPSFDVRQNQNRSNTNFTNNTNNPAKIAAVTAPAIGDQMVPGAAMSLERARAAAIGTKSVAGAPPLPAGADPAEKDLKVVRKYVPDAAPTAVMAKGYTPPSSDKPGAVLMFALPNDPAFFRDGKPLLEPVNNLNVVGGHGYAKGDGAGMMAEPMANGNLGSHTGDNYAGIPVGMMKKRLDDAGANPNAAIYLSSCHTGNSAYPQHLADTMNQDVIAATKPVLGEGTNRDTVAGGGVFMLFAKGKDPVAIGDTYTVNNGVGTFSWSGTAHADGTASGANRTSSAFGATKP